MSYNKCCIKDCKNEKGDFIKERLCHHHFNAIVAKMFGDNRPVEEIPLSTQVK